MDRNETQVFWGFLVADILQKAGQRLRELKVSENSAKNARSLVLVKNSQGRL